jgi:ankyrin repeat protein
MEPKSPAESHFARGDDQSKRHEAVVRLLLSNGADVNAKDKLDQTPLDIVVGQGHDEIVETT